MTIEPEAIPADVLELARRLADENELSLFNEDLIVHAIMADRASRAPAPKPAGGEWRYEIQHGPDGEQNYAFVFDADGALVSNLKIHHARAVVAAMNAAAPPAPAALPSGGEVVVKPLEWRRGYCDDQVIIEQASFGGLYQVRQFDGDIWLDHPSASSSKHETVGAAKAAAQADFEQRIRSALTSPEAPQASEVVRAADDRYPSVFYAHDRSNRISVGHYNTASGWSPHIHVETSLENKPGARWVQVSLTPDEAEQFALHILNKVSHARSFIQVTKHGPTPPTIDEVTGEIISLGNVRGYESRRIVNPAHIAAAIRALAHTTGQEPAPTCPICAEPFKADDICAADINEGTCHAECLEGSPVVYLDTGEPSDGPVDTFTYGQEGGRWQS